jgi:DNA-binding SARP family transcriptional activator
MRKYAYLPEGVVTIFAIYLYSSGILITHKKYVYLNIAEGASMNLTGNLLPIPDPVSDLKLPASSLFSRTENGRYLQIHCLGGFRVMRDHTLVRDRDWKSNKAKTFVKLLVAQYGKSLSRDIVLETLWPDTADDTLVRTFNSMLHRARKALDPINALKDAGSFILQKDGIVALNRERVWTDVGQFLSHLDAADCLKSKMRPSNAVSEYENAIALYQGDFLPENLYNDWATHMRDRLRISYLRALEDAAGLAESSGDIDRALRFNEKLFLADPCHEKACCWLMTRYRSDTRRGEAIRTYERCERALSRELDLEPEEKTKKLYRSFIEE